MDSLRLKKIEAEALEEVARSNAKGLCYWWRPKTMQRLQSKGLVEQWSPPSVLERPRLKARPWRLTDAGKMHRARINTLALVTVPPAPKEEGRG